MPLYDFNCPNHGKFSRLVPLAKRNEPIACPNCECIAERLMSAPRLALMDSRNRTAWERNERSAHEPMLRKKHSCTHTHHNDQHANPSERPQLKSGSANARPWMLGH